MEKDAVKLVVFNDKDFSYISNSYVPLEGLTVYVLLK
jgi:hypothetical protein